MKNSKRILFLSLTAVLIVCSLLLNIKVKAQETVNESTTYPAEEMTTEKVPQETEVDVPPQEETTKVSPSPTKPVPVNGYIVTKENGILKASYQGKIQKNVYLALVVKDGNEIVTAPKTKGAFIYYFDSTGAGKKYIKTGLISITYQNKSYKYYVKSGKLGTGWYQKKNKKYYYSSGKMVTGWKKIKGKKYYFSKSKKKKGQLLTNTIVTTKKKSYYVDSTGVRVTSKDVKLAVKFVTAHTKKSWSSGKKLSTCYHYLCQHFSYKRFYDSPTASSMPGYEKYMLTNGRGNCYRYAATFAYIAKVLGYDSRVAVGKVTSLDGGMTPHGWTEVKVNGNWYICDADLQSESKGVDSYMKTESTYKYEHTCSGRYTIKIKNGKVSWK